MKKVVILLSLMLSIALYSCDSKILKPFVKKDKHTMVYAHVPLADGTELGMFYFDYPISGDSIKSMMMEKGFEFASSISLLDFAKIAKKYPCFRSMSPMATLEWSVDKPLYNFHGKEIISPTRVYSLNHPELIEDVEKDITRNSVSDSISFTSPKRYHSWFLALNIKTEK